MLALNVFFVILEFVGDIQDQGRSVIDLANRLFLFLKHVDGLFDAGEFFFNFCVYYFDLVFGLFYL